MIKKQSDNYLSEAYWLEKIKIAVESKRVDKQLFSDLNSIVKSKKSKYSSVSEAVKEMMERSGLTKYLESKKISNKVSKKANTNIKLFEVCPQAETTLNNIIESAKGYLALPAVISKLKSYHLNDVKDPSLFEDDNLSKYIINKNIQLKADDSNISSNLGKADNETDMKEEQSIIFGK